MNTTFALKLDDYAQAVDAGWTHYEIYRAIMHDLPRRFHALPTRAQRTVLGAPPRLTGTRWDALLAATVEHVARLHGHEIPAWAEEGERFLDSPWVIPRSAPMRRDAIRFAPAAFIRHGALPDPKDLDARGGERHGWLP